MLPAGGESEHVEHGRIFMYYNQHIKKFQYSGGADVAVGLLVAFSSPEPFYSTVALTCCGVVWRPWFVAALETNRLNQYKKGKYVQSNELNLECTTPKFNVEPEIGGL